MKKVPVEKIEKGMVLARDIRTGSGNILLGSDSNLTPAMGRRLRNWGVSFVYVQGEEESTKEYHEESPAPHEIRKHLEHKFSDVKQDPFMQQIFNAVYRYRIGKEL